MNEITLPSGTIRYRDVGTGPTLVFVHGVLVDGSLWDGVVERLSPQFRCIAPDWPLGSHVLPMNDDADLTPGGVARIVSDFLAALDLRDVTLVGNDSGGAVCQLVVTDHPDRIGRLVLTPCDAFERFPPPDFEYMSLLPKMPLLAAIMAKLMHAFPRLTASKYGFGTVAKHGFDRAQLRRWTRPAAKNRRVRRDLLKFIAGVSPAVTLAAAEKLPGVATPALILWAPEDRHFTMDYGERLRDALPDATLVTVDDSYAFAPLDQPGAVADAIDRFARPNARVSNATSSAAHASH